MDANHRCSFWPLHLSWSSNPEVLSDERRITTTSPSVNLHHVLLDIDNIWDICVYLNIHIYIYICCIRYINMLYTVYLYTWTSQEIQQITKTHIAIKEKHFTTSTDNCPRALLPEIRPPCGEVLSFSKCSFWRRPLGRASGETRAWKNIITWNWLVVYNYFHTIYIYIYIYK